MYLQSHYSLISSWLVLREIQLSDVFLPLASCYLLCNRTNYSLSAAGAFMDEVEVLKGYVFFFFNVVFLKPEPIKEVNERQTAAGLWIGNDLWVNWTSQETVNRQLTFILANLHLLELKIQRQTWRRMTERPCQTSTYRKILNPELHDIMSVNYMKLHIWPDIKRERIYSESVS